MQVELGPQGEGEQGSRGRGRHPYRGASLKNPGGQKHIARPDLLGMRVGHKSTKAMQKTYLPLVTDLAGAQLAHWPQGVGLQGCGDGTHLLE